MKKILLSLGIVASLFASDKILPKTEALSLLKLTPIYYRVAPELGKNIKLKGVEKEDFYILTLQTPQGSGNIYLTKNKKYTILGNVFDNKKHQMILPHYKVDKKVIDKGVVFTFGKGKTDIYIVTDPQCPFCREFEKKSKDSNLAKNYKVHVIFLPLSFHKYSKDMIYYILSAKTEAEKAKRFHETLQGGNEWKNFKPTKAQKEAIDKKIKESEKAAAELGAQGTPSFYDSKFNEINRNKLLKK